MPALPRLPGCPRPVSESPRPSSFVSPGEFPRFANGASSASSEASACTTASPASCCASAIAAPRSLRSTTPRPTSISTRRASSSLADVLDVELLGGSASHRLREVVVRRLPSEGGTSAAAREARWRGGGANEGFVARPPSRGIVAFSRADHRLAGTSDASAATCSTARSSRLRIEGIPSLAAFGRVVAAPSSHPSSCPCWNYPHASTLRGIPLGIIKPSKPTIVLCDRHGDGFFSRSTTSSAGYPAHQRRLVPGRAPARRLSCSLAASRSPRSRAHAKIASLAFRHGVRRASKVSSNSARRKSAPSGPAVIDTRRAAPGPSRWSP